MPGTVRRGGRAEFSAEARRGLFVLSDRSISSRVASHARIATSLLLTRLRLPYPPGRFHIQPPSVFNRCREQAGVCASPAGRSPEAARGNRAVGWCAARVAATAAMPVDARVSDTPTVLGTTDTIKVSARAGPTSLVPRGHRIGSSRSHRSSPAFVSEPDNTDRSVSTPCRPRWRAPAPQVRVSLVDPSGETPLTLARTSIMVATMLSRRRRGARPAAHPVDAVVGTFRRQHLAAAQTSPSRR
jgi:hypothetical protein